MAIFEVVNMSFLDGNLKDQNRVPVDGALAYIFAPDGSLATIKDQAGQDIQNPVKTGEDGYWRAYVEQDGFYTIRYFWGGRERLIEANRLAGRSPLEIVQAYANASAALFAGIPYPSLAAGEAATEVGALFSYRDDDGLVALADHKVNGAVPLDLMFSASVIAASNDSMRSVADKLSTRLGADSGDYAGASDRATIQAMLDANPGGKVVINWRVLDWQIDGSLYPANGTRIVLQDGARIAWTGPTPLAPKFIFDLSGTTGVRISVEGRGEALFTAPEPMPMLWIAGGFKVIDFKLSDCHGHNVNHVFATAALDREYADIRTPGYPIDDDAHDCSRKIRVIRGGSTFDYRTGQNVGSCYLAYTFDAKVVGSEYVRTPHGVQGWGGDSAPDANGVPTNERKCGDIKVSQVDCKDVSGAAVWASMARDLEVVNCRSDLAHDVAFDAEGCHGATFRGCWAKDAVNGNYATFNLNRGVLFENCISIVSDGDEFLHFCLYNATQTTANEDITIDGGTWNTLAGIGLITTASGPCKEFTVRDIKGRNTAINAVGNNGNQVTVTGNSLLFTRALTPGTTAIEITGAAFDGKSLAAVVVHENRVITEVAQPTGSGPIRTRATDYNVANKFSITGNHVRGPWPAEAIRGDSAAGNPGVYPAWVVNDNDLEDPNGLGAALIFIAAASGSGEPVVQRFDNYDAAGNALEAA